MGQRLLQRKLHQTSSRIRELREELRIVEDQLSQLAADADEKALRALVAETPVTAFEHRDAQKHADVMQRHYDKVKANITELEKKMDELLDRLGTENS
jgi:peptidoglycan hydrolase CwlO-like protein